MKTLLICHDGERLDQQVLPRWLASFSDVVGIVVVRESRRRVLRRIRRELSRVGVVRFCDVLAFRLYYALFLRRADSRRETQILEELLHRYAPTGDVPQLITSSPNSPEAERFVRDRQPDIVLARCKVLLAERVFSIPTHGTFVMHPGICPEYRNSHGCFWALARSDRERVGMTLLRIDRGIDTGPVYGYFRAALDEVRDSHIIIQHRVVYDNLGEIARTLERIDEQNAEPFDTSGRASRMWGQPWLTAYMKWKYKARRDAREVAWSR